MNKIWIYLKLIENKNWHVVPSWWSIIEPKSNQSNIFEWYTLEEIKKNIIVISGSKWNGAVRGRNLSRLFPTCRWLFLTCHLPSWVPQMPLTELFHLLPSTSHRGTPTVRAKWKTAKECLQFRSLLALRLTVWTQIRALIRKMTMFPAMKTNIFQLITWKHSCVIVPQKDFSL